MKLLSLLLCLQFALSPLAVAQSTATSSCSSGDKACYESRARDVLKQAESDGKVEEELKSKGGLINTGMKAATVAVPLLLVTHLLFKGKQTPPKCGSLSLYMLIGGGAILFLGNIFANTKHKSRLKKIKKEWEGTLAKKGNGGETSGTSVAATEGQAEAFEMLAKSEDSMASTAKFKAGIHGVAAAAFAAASVMAIMENSRLMGLKAAMVAKQVRFNALPAVPPGPKATAFTEFKTATTQYTEFYQKVHCSNATPPATDTPMDEIQNFEDGLEEAANPQAFLDRRSIENLRSAQDLASFLTLHEGLEKSLETRSSPSLDDYAHFKESTKEVDDLGEVLSYVKEQSIAFLLKINPLPVAQAEGEAAVAEAEGPEILVRGTKMPKLGFINKYLFAPVPRAAISGVFAVWSGIMAMHSSKQAKVAQNRAKFLREQKKAFNDSNGQLVVGSKTGTTGGQSGGQGADAQAGTGSGIQSLAGISQDKTCMTSSGLDPSCKCRASNSCLQATPSNLSPQAFGLSQETLSFGASGTNPLNAVASGRTSAASIDAASAVNNASSLLAARNKTAGKLKGVAEEQAKLTKEAASEFSRATSGVSLPGALASNSPSGFNMSPASAAAELEKELKKASDDDLKERSGGAGNTVSPVAVESSLSEGEITAAQVDEVMKQDLDYSETGTDISSSQDSIFSVISNRYQRTNTRLTVPQEESTKP